MKCELPNINCLFLAELHCRTMETERTSIRLDESEAAIKTSLNGDFPLQGEFEAQPDTTNSRGSPPASLVFPCAIKFVATGFSLLAWFSIGLAAGFLGAEAYSWARWGLSTGPRLAEAFRFVGLKLPWASWIGIERLLEWAFGQSIFLCAALVLTALFICYCVVASALRGLRRGLTAAAATRRSDKKPRADTDFFAMSENMTVMACQIEQAFELLDRRSCGTLDSLTSVPNPSVEISAEHNNDGANIEG